MRQSIDFVEMEKKLGKGAKLGISFYLLDHDGHVIAEDSYEGQRALPMASTKKIAIALLVLKKIFDENRLNLSDQITLDECDFSPGPSTNPLDQYFFNFSGNYPPQIKTVEELLILMLTYSDNTATDKLLALTGGPKAVNELMLELGVSGYTITRNCRQLLGDYFGISTEKTRENCELMMKELAVAFTLHASEQIIFSGGEDSCTPQAMSQLICLILKAAAQGDDEWLSVAANHIIPIMKMCKTGSNRIRKAVADLTDVECVGNKTGSLGGIANDAAFIQFKDGTSAVMTINTSQSPLSLSEREAVIASAARLVLGHHRQLVCTNVEEDLNVQAFRMFR